MDWVNVLSRKTVGPAKRVKEEQSHGYRHVYEAEVEDAFPDARGSGDHERHHQTRR